MINSSQREIQVVTRRRENGYQEGEKNLYSLAPENVSPLLLSLPPPRLSFELTNDLLLSYV